MSSPGSLKSFERVIFPSKHPERIIELIDEIVKTNSEFESRSDFFRKSLEEFFAAGFDSLFDGHLYKATSVRISKEINSKLDRFLVKSEIVRIALILALRNHYEVIPNE